MINIQNLSKNIIDFILSDITEGDNNAEVEREEWLSELAKTRRINDEKSDN